MVASVIKAKLLGSLAFLIYRTGLIKAINYFVATHTLARNSHGQLCLPYIKKRQSWVFHILIYHRINDDYDPFFPGTPVSVFEKQMEYLADDFNVCDLADLVERIDADDVPKKTVVVTFDDGYRDNFLNAYPILRKYSIPTTIFLATDAIGSNKILWHDRVFSAFRETKMPLLKGFLGAERYPLTCVAEKLAAQAEILKRLWRMTEQERFPVVECLRKELGVADDGKQSDVMLSWEDVITMHKNGISFGSHSVTHPALATLSTNRMREELAVSKRTIEEKLQTRVTAFAYPRGSVGDFNERTKLLLKETGYRCAVTTRFGLNVPGCDRYELRRGTPWEHDPYRFALKLSWYRFAATEQADRIG